MVAALVVALQLSARHPPATALEAFARGLSAAGMIPESSAALRRICARHLSAAFRQEVGAGEVARWRSIEDDCFVEIAPSSRSDRAAAAITFGCRFLSALEAGTFLRNAAIRPMEPSLPEQFPEELHHRAVTTIGTRLIGVEFHLTPAADSHAAAVVLTDGWRIVLPEPGGESQ